MLMEFKIDLNCDMAEGIGNEALIMPWISSANIACGYHAGDEDLMKFTVDLCMEHTVAIGAHPSFPDRANFGRTIMELPLNQLFDIVLEQITLLKKITDSSGARLHHVKPHGALYNMAAKDPFLSEAICNAIMQIDGSLIFYGLSGSSMIDQARKQNLISVNEVFADRTYQSDGSLTPRTQKDALLTDEGLVRKQAIRFAKDGEVIDIHGNQIRLKADSICLHSDGENAVAHAKSIHEALVNHGIRIQALKN